MKKQFFPQPQNPFKLATPTRATKPVAPKTAQSLVDLKVITKADSQNIMHVWFDSLDGPSFATSLWTRLPQHDEFVCLFCQHKTYDTDPMVSHFLAHVEKDKFVLSLSSNPTLLKAFRTLLPLTSGDPLEAFKKTLQQGAINQLQTPGPRAPELTGLAEKVLATFPPKPEPKK